MNILPFISVIIPCRNEEKYIAKCLDSVALQDYPKEKLEILVVDGASEDRTREIVAEYAKNYPFVRLLENNRKFTPFGLNVGIKNARGSVIARMDAHAKYPSDYISKCANHLAESGADNVGGVIQTLPSKDTNEAKAVAFCLSHFFGAGGSHFRTGAENPMEVDTVFGGCYKKEIFQKIGLFNENLLRSQDIELNRRLKKSGGKIMLFPDITAVYYPKATLEGFFRHNFNDGVWTLYPLRFGLRIFSLRHLIPLAFVSLLAISLLFSVFGWLFPIYILADLYFSFQISRRENNSGVLGWIFLAFAARHFGYGLGSSWGLIKALLKK